LRQTGAAFKQFYIEGAAVYIFSRGATPTQPIEFDREVQSPMSGFRSRSSRVRSNRELAGPGEAARHSEYRVLFVQVITLRESTLLFRARHS
jgi:hypothetical protein